MTIEEYYKDRRDEYAKAVELVRVYLDFLKNDSTLISKIESRVKTLDSLKEKCRRKGVPAKDIFDKIHDIAGVRCICKYRDYASRLVERIKTLSLAGFSVVGEKDYNSNPKQNGYSGHHLDCMVTVPTIDGNKMVPVEIQIRTLAQDAWAVIEHDHYKEMLAKDKSYKDDDPETLAALQEIARYCAGIDERAIKLREKTSNNSAPL